MAVENLDQAIELAVEARANGGDSQEYIDTLKDNVRAGKSIDELQALLNLIVITYNEATLLKPGIAEYLRQFWDEADWNSGNGKRYIKHFPQIPQNYDASKFIPTEVSSNAFKVHFLKFKNDDGTLAEGSEQKVYQIVYIQEQLITYFINGKMRKFIEEEILAQLEQPKLMYMYEKVVAYQVDTLNTDGTAKNGKLLNGQGANLFESIVELLDEVALMRQTSSEYNVDKTLVEAFDSSAKENLIMLVSPKVKTMLGTDVMSQLFNAAKIELTEHVGQVYVPDNKFDFTGPTIKSQNVCYVDDETIIVFDKKNYVRFLDVLKFAGSQDYVTNMAHQKVIHQWFAKTKLPWGKVLTYKNANLTVSPSKA